MLGGLSKLVSSGWDKIPLKKSMGSLGSLVLVGSHMLPERSHDLPNYDNMPVSTEEFEFVEGVSYLVLVSDDGDPETKGDDYIKKISEKAGFDGEHFHVELFIDGLFYGARYGELGRTRTKEQMAEKYGGSEYILKPIHIPDTEAAIDWFDANTLDKVYTQESDNCTYCAMGMLGAGGYKHTIEPVVINTFLIENPDIAALVFASGVKFKYKTIVLPDQMDAYGEQNKEKIYKGRLERK